MLPLPHGALVTASKFAFWGTCQVKRCRPAQSSFPAAITAMPSTMIVPPTIACWPVWPPSSSSTTDAPPSEGDDVAGPPQGFGGVSLPHPVMIRAKLAVSRACLMGCLSNPVLRYGAPGRRMPAGFRIHLRHVRCILPVKRCVERSSPTNQRSLDGRGYHFGSVQRHVRDGPFWLN